MTHNADARFSSPEKTRIRGNRADVAASPRLLHFFGPPAVVSIVANLPTQHARPRVTRLETFLKSRGIRPVRLARESGYSRQHLLRIRFALMQPSATCAAALVVALRRLTREPVTLRDLFSKRLVNDLERDVRAVLGTLDDRERAEIIAAVPRPRRRRR